MGKILYKSFLLEPLNHIHVIRNMARMSLRCPSQNLALIVLISQPRWPPSQLFIVLKQQWTIEEISIFSNSSHLEWRAGLSDTISKRTHPARFGLIWFSGFRGEDLNVKVYDVYWNR
jgi:hypothetical protein